MRCLLIEDEAETARYIVNGLAQSGFEIDSVGDCRQGLALATQQPWDAIVLDRMLPGDLDGSGRAGSLRRAGNNTPVLILSALANPHGAGTGVARRCRRLSDQALRLRRTAGPPRGSLPPRNGA